jgi:ABC-type transporter Mla maintaining outer membrane lipid asymmetry ATPase subunit MlaF
MVEKVDAMIARARRQREMTSVVISHDLASVRRIADRVAFLHGGKIIFQGTYDELVASTLPPIRAFVAATRQAGGSPRAEIGTTPVAELVGVHKWFGNKHVLRGVDFTIYDGGITALIGASGSGKSVIAKHILGLLEPDAGKVVVFNTDIATISERDSERSACTSASFSSTRACSTG